MSGFLAKVIPSEEGDDCMISREGIQVDTQAIVIGHPAAQMMCILCAEERSQIEFF